MKKTMLLAVMAGLMIGTFAIAQIPDIDIPGVDKKDKKKAEKIIKEAEKADKAVKKARKDWDYPDERATGQTVAAQVAKSYGGIWKNDAWTKYVNLVGRTLVPKSERSDIKYRFAILNSNEVNAFSCPGGYIFITKGLLKRIKNEAQLAGVLAHEIAHTAKRHVENSVKRQNEAAAWMEGGIGIAKAAGVKPDANTIKTVKEVAGQGYNLLVKTGYSREDEYEADQLATDNIYKLGYSPTAVVGLLDKMDEEGKVSEFETITRTHPSNADRKKTINKRVKEKGYQVEGKATNVDRYQKMLEKNPIK